MSDRFMGSIKQFFINTAMRIAAFPPPPPGKPETVGRILLVAGGYLGDTFWGLQVIPRLREAWPDAELFVIGRGFCKALCYGVLPADHVIATTVLVSDRTREKLSIAALMREAAHIRKHLDPDLVFDLMGNRFSSLFCRKIGAFSIGSNVNNAFHFLYSESVDLSGLPPHLACRPRGLVGGWLHDPPSDGIPEKLTPPRTEFSREELRKKLDIPAEAKIAVLCPGAGWAAKRWHPERFRELAESLADSGFLVFIAGSPAELPLCQTVAGTRPDVRILTESLEILISLLPCCSLYVGSDSGTTHLAAAFGIPTIALFCQTNPKYCGPLGEHVTVVRSHCPDIPEETHFCKNKIRLTCASPACMDIPASQVELLLRRAPVSQGGGIPRGNGESRMLRILVPVAYSELGGSQVFLLKLMDAMASDQTVQFTCWLYQDGPLAKELAARNIPYRRVRFFMKNPVFLLSMIRELKKENADVVYLHASRFLALAAKLAHVPCVERINMSRNTLTGGWCRHPWVDRLFTSFNTKALAVSDAIRRQLLARGIADRKICVIRNFVELDRFRRPAEAERTVFRKELGLDDDSTAVLNVGRFMPQKAQSDYLKIASIAVKQCPKLKFFLLGDGNGKAPLERETGELGLQDNVVFLPFRNDAEKIYGAVDILLHTAHWDPLANVLLEGMAASLPVAATDVDGTAEVIRDRETGLLFRKGDIEAGAEIVLELAENPVLRRRLGCAARRYVEEHHTVKTVVAQYKKLFSNTDS